MKERNLSKTLCMTFVYLSKCNINLPYIFGNSKKRFLWAGLLVMDYSGVASPYSDLLTNILLPISIISLVLCEVFNSFESPIPESQEPLMNCRKHRKRVERLRNLSLCAGQLFWLVLPDLATRLPDVPPMLCQACSHSPGVDALLELCRWWIMWTIFSDSLF